MSGLNSSTYDADEAVKEGPQSVRGNAAEGYFRVKRSRGDGAERLPTMMDKRVAVVVNTVDIRAKYCENRWIIFKKRATCAQDSSQCPMGQNQVVLRH